MPYDGTGLDETTKVLLEAWRLVEEGWCQGAYQDAAGRVCLSGAVSLGSLACNPNRSGWWDAYLAVQALLPRHKRELTCALSQWNDAPERTQAEVLALLDRAIAGGDKG